MTDNSRENKILAFLKAHIFDLIFNIPSFVTVVKWIYNIVVKAEFTTLEIVLSALILINSLIWIIIVRNYYGYPSICWNAPYEYTSRIISYVRHSQDDSVTISRSGIVKSKINGLGRIRDRYLWTGATDADLPVGTLGVSDIRKDESIGIWTYFSVNFKDVLSKGKTEAFKYVWESIQQCSSSSPFLSIDTEYETKDLTFEVTLGKEYANHKIKLEQYRSIESECPITSTEAILDEEGHYAWNIHKPLRYRYFRVRWEWIKP